MRATQLLLQTGADAIMIPKMSAQIAAVLTRSPNKPSTYEPLSSVWERSDGELLEAMLTFYPTIAPEPILDATYNAGRFWNGSKREIVSMDIEPRYNTDIVGDNRKMKGVKSNQFGVVVYDPPHVGPQGRD